MKIVELVLDENGEDMGITAISVVSSPATEERFIALKSQEFKFAEQDKEKRLMLGAALVPNKPIFRKGQNEDEDYYIFFSKETIRKASELFFINGNQSESTLEHDTKLEGLTVCESWIVESEVDKSRHYGLDVPVGTWMVSVKCSNDKVWEKVKKNEVSGFSIEAFFSDRMSTRPKDKTLKEEAAAQEFIESISKILKDAK